MVFSTTQCDGETMDQEINTIDRIENLFKSCLAADQLAIYKT